MKNMVRYTFTFFILFLLFCSNIACSSESKAEKKEDDIVNDQDISITDYDVILAQGGDYTIVAKLISGFDTNHVEIGVLNADLTEWVHPYSANHIFVNNGKHSSQTVWVGDNNTIQTRGVSYAGEDMFIGEVTGISGKSDEAFYDAGNDFGFLIEDLTFVRTTGSYGANSNMNFENGITAVEMKGATSSWVASLDKKGNLITLEGVKSNDTWIGKYSEGLFFADGGFYDINGELQIDLSQYNGKFISTNPPYFENGVSVMHLIGEDGNEYIIEINLQGEILSGPTIVEE